MTPGTTEAGRRVKLRRCYAEYRKDPAFARVRAEAENTLVPGDGPIRPRLMFIGEAPGRLEAQQRKPFVGASGRLLNEMLESVGLKREDVFITNVVKFRPKDNRDPTHEEVAASIPWLRREHRVLGLPPIVVLGKHARRTVEWDHRLKHGLIIGQWSWMKWDGGFPVLPLYHPAYGIYQRANRPMMFEQFKAVLTPPKSPEECHAAQ